MLAFELSINGKTVQKVGVGDEGILDAGVRWLRQNNEELILRSSGRDVTTQRSVGWSDHELLPGDIVTIRVVDEVDFAPDPPPRLFPSLHDDP